MIVKTLSSEPKKNKQWLVITARRYIVIPQSLRKVLEGGSLTIKSISQVSTIETNERILPHDCTLGFQILKRIFLYFWLCLKQVHTCQYRDFFSVHSFFFFFKSFQFGAKNQCNPSLITTRSISSLEKEMDKKETSFKHTHCSTYYYKLPQFLKELNFFHFLLGGLMLAIPPILCAPIVSHFNFMMSNPWSNSIRQVVAAAVKVVAAFLFVY